MFPSVWASSSATHTHTAADGASVCSHNGLVAGTVTVRTDVPVPIPRLVQMKPLDSLGCVVNLNLDKPLPITDHIPSTGHKQVLIRHKKSPSHDGSRSLHYADGSSKDVQLENAAQVLQHLQISNPVFYFEVTLSPSINQDSHTIGGGVCVGLVSSIGFTKIHSGASAFFSPSAPAGPKTTQHFVSHLEDQLPGQVQCSIGYHSDGRVLLRSGPEEQAQCVCVCAPYGVHDIIGCGIEIGGRGRVFFTLNGRMVGFTNVSNSNQVYILDAMRFSPRPFFPCVGIESQANVCVKGNFGQAAFVMFAELDLNMSLTPVSPGESALRGLICGDALEPPRPRVVVDTARAELVENEMMRLARLISLNDGDRELEFTSRDEEEIRDLVSYLNDQIHAEGRRPQPLSPNAGSNPHVDNERRPQRSNSGPVSPTSPYPSPQTSGRPLSLYSRTPPTPMDMTPLLWEDVADAIQSSCLRLQKLGRRLKRVISAEENAIEDHQSIDGPEQMQMLLQLNDMVTQTLDQASHYFPLKAAKNMPSMIEMVNMIRRGCGDEGSSSSLATHTLIRLCILSDDCRKEVLGCGGLHLLLNAAATATPVIGETEMGVELLVSLLIPHERHFPSLVAPSHSSAVLSAMRMLAIRDRQEIKSLMAVVDDIIPQSELLDTPSTTWVHLQVSMAAEHMALSYLQNDLSSQQSYTQTEEPIPQMSHSNSLSGAGAPLRRMGSGPWPVDTFDNDFTKSIESLVHLVQLLAGYTHEQPRSFLLRNRLRTVSTAKPRSPTFRARTPSISMFDTSEMLTSTEESMSVHKVSVFCAKAIGHLANSSKCRGPLVSCTGVLPMLVEWLQLVTEQLLITEQPSAAEDHLQIHSNLKEMDIHMDLVTHTTAAIAHLVGADDPDMSENASYLKGWIESHLLTEGCVSALIDLALISQLLPVNVLSNVSSTLHELLYRSKQNRDKLFKSGALDALMSIVINLVRPECDVVPPNKHSPLEKSLNGISYLIGDLDVDLAANLLTVLCTQSFLTSLQAILSQKRGGMRLAAVRVTSILSEIKPCAKVLLESLVSDPLLIIASEAFHFDENGPNTHTAHAPQQQTPTNAIVHTQQPTSTSIFLPVSPALQSQPLRTVGPAMYHENESEEATRTAYTLANMCEEEECARAFVEKGLVDIMLKLSSLNSPSSSAIVFHSLRCIASMCPSLLTLTHNHAADRHYLAMCARTLRTLAMAIKSHDPDTQTEALRGIVALARDEQLQVYVVEGPLKYIVHTLVDTSCDLKRRELAEAALAAVGFSGGAADAQKCGNDVQLMTEWYRIKQSLKPQMLAYKYLKDFMKKLWKRDSHLGDATWSSASFRGTGLHQSQSHRSNSQTLGDMTSFFGLPEVVAEKVLGQFVQVFETWKILRKGIAHAAVAATGPIHPYTPTHAPSLSSHSYTPRTPYSGGKSNYDHKGNSFSELVLRHILCYPAFGRRSGASTLQGSEVEFDDVNSRWNSDLTDLAENRHTNTELSRQDGIDEGGDATPYVCSNVQELLDMLFASKLEQYVCMDRIQLSSSANLNFVHPPRPKPFAVLLMPERSYLSFNREGRMLHRLLRPQEPVSENNPMIVDDNTSWGLVFKNSLFDGEFYDTLLHTLQQNPQIQSLSFINSVGDTRDTRIGHMAGSISDSIRSMTFENVLGSEALQAMCLLLRQQNPSFFGEEGLQGLAIHTQTQTHHTHTLTADDVQHLVMLLDSDTESPRNRNAFMSSPEVAPPTGCRGLLWLDLSLNGLRDGLCSDILRAARGSPSLTALDLSGNNIKHGTQFSVAFGEAMSDHRCKLRHLLLNNSQVSEKCAKTIFTSLAAGGPLHSLGLAMNGLPTNDEIKRCLRQLLRSNKQLYELDLRGNKFNEDVAKSLELGLLENDSMRCLYLKDNLGILDRTILIISERLESNRLRAAKTPKMMPALSQRARSDTAMRVTTQLEPTLSPIPGVVVSRTRGNTSETEQSDIPYLQHAEPYYDFFVDDASPISTHSVISNSLCVLFSAPLAWRDKNQKLHPIELLDYETEREMLWQVLKQSQRDVVLECDFATTDTLRSMVTMGCRVLHFSGHGHPQALNFEDGRGGLQFVTADRLRDLCTAGSTKAHTLECVFVSACYSHSAGEAFVQAGVPHVVCVCVHAQLLDSAATAFTRQFYLALTLGHTVQDAFHIGRQAVLSSPLVVSSEAEHDKFLLLPVDGDHNVRIFTSHERQHKQGSYSLLNLHTVTHLPFPPEDFLGREVDMYNVIYQIHHRRFVALIGKTGVGKTAACAVCRYIAERKMFEDGVIYVRMHGVFTHVEAVKAIRKATGIVRSKIHVRTEQTQQIAKSSSSERSPSALTDVMDEDWLVDVLGPARCLLVLDHVEDILGAQEPQIEATQTRVFLARLFQHCRHLKILYTADNRVRLPHSSDVRDCHIDLEGLSLQNSLRLFARLTPHLVTAQDKLRFVQALCPPQLGLAFAETVIRTHLSSSYNCDPTAVKILKLFGNGHPGAIVKLAWDVEEETFRLMEAECCALIQAFTQLQQLEP